MNDDTIKDLLRQADRAAGTRSAPPGLADLVRRRMRRQRVVTTKRYVAAAAAIIVITSGAILILSRSKPPGRSAPVDEFTKLRTEIEQLRAEADTRMAIIEQMLARQSRKERLARLEWELARPDPVEQVRLELERTACIMVYQANRMYQELDLPESAVKSYRQVIELFPETHWAKVARQRLTKIEGNQTHPTTSKGDLL